MKKVSTGGSRQTMKNDPNKGSVYTIYFIVYTIHTRPCFGDVIGNVMAMSLIAGRYVLSIGFISSHPRRLTIHSPVLVHL